MGFGNSVVTTAVGAASDVALSNPQSNQALIYDGAVAKWKNASQSGGSSSVTAAKDTAASGNTTLTAGTSPSITKFTGTFSADRTITLAAGTAGSVFEFSFIEANLNGYNLTVTNGTFSHVFSYPTYVKYVNISGSGWERIL